MNDEALYLEALYNQDGHLQIGIHMHGDVVSPYETLSSVPLARLESFCHETITVLNRAARSSSNSVNAHDKLKTLGQMIGDELLTPAIKKYIKQTSTKHIIFRLDDQLIHIPWELLCIDEEFLCQRFSLGRLVKTKQKVVKSSDRSLQQPYDMWVVTHYGSELQSTDEEGMTICHKMDAMNKEKMIINASLDSYITPGEVMERLRNYDFVHFAGHADYDLESVEENGWRLIGGNLTGPDIYKMSGGASMPALIFSNACHSARSDEVTQEGDSLGLANAFMLTGVKHYIGSLWEIPDKPSQDFASHFYQQLLEGQPIGEAVRLARKALEEDQNIPACWASYLLYGDPTTTYFEPSGLRLIHETESGEEIYPIPLSGELTLGRRKSSTVVIDKTTVSRLHLVISIKDGTVVMDVLGQNGIELAGEVFRGQLTVDSPLRFDLWGDWFRLEGSLLYEEEQPTEYIR